MTVEVMPERVTVEVMRTVTSDSEGVEEEWPPIALLVLQDDQHDDLNMNMKELTRWR